MDRLHLLAWMSALAAGAALFITRLGPSPLPLACAMMAIFMVTMSGRFSPAMAMITNAVSARYRGGFMSVNAALQQAASAAANILAGWFITRDAAGHLLGFPNLGYVAVILFAFTVFLAARLRAAAPHVARPATA
jgi:MFS family permease